MASNNSTPKGFFPSITYHSTVAKLSIAQKRVRKWYLYFSDGAPSSIAESRNLVAQALAEMSNHVGSHNWGSPVNPPAIIQEWLGRQKNASIKGRSSK